MSLPEGVYLVSDIFPENVMQPIFAEKVVPLNLWEKQWDRIIKANAHQRICDIFETEDEYKKWMAEANYIVSKHKKIISH